MSDKLNKIWKLYLEYACLDHHKIRDVEISIDYCLSFNEPSWRVVHYGYLNEIQEKHFSSFEEAKEFLFQQFRIILKNLLKDAEERVQYMDDEDDAEYQYYWQKVFEILNPHKDFLNNAVN